MKGRIFLTAAFLSVLLCYSLVFVLKQARADICVRIALEQACPSAPSADRCDGGWTMNDCTNHKKHVVYANLFGCRVYDQSVGKDCVADTAGGKANMALCYKAWACIWSKTLGCVQGSLIEAPEDPLWKTIDCKEP
jgi:hypothetical protein